MEPWMTATVTGGPEGRVHSTDPRVAAASHGITQTTAATIRVRRDPSTSAVSAPAQTSSAALIPYTPAMGAKRDSQVSVWEYPSDSHENPDRNQPRHHSISSHAAGTATSQRIGPASGSHRATTYPRAA